MSGTAMMPEALKIKADGLAAGIKGLLDKAKKTNESNPNIKDLTKANADADAEKLAAELETEKSTMDDFNPVAKALATLVKSAQGTVAKVKAPTKTTDSGEAEEPKVIYASTKVERACSGSKVQTKVASIFKAGKSHKGTSTPYLKASHDHVTNDDAVAFVWRGNDLHVVAYGTKPAKKSITGDGGYVWAQ